jgi:hypothetical protein
MMSSGSIRWITGFCLAMFLVNLGCRSERTGNAPSSVSSSAVIEKVTERGPVKLIIRVSPSEPRLSDVIELELLVATKEGVEVAPPTFGQAVGDFVVLDYSERNVDMLGNSLPPHSRLFRYRLEPESAGKHLIRSLAIDFSDLRSDSEASGNKSRIESEPIELNITSEWGDQLPDLANLEPMIAPKDISSVWSWWWGVPIVLLASLASLAFWLTRKRSRTEINLPKQSPAEIANIQLALLLSEDLPGKRLFTEFYVRLTGIVRQYIEGTTGIRAPEQTTEEFLRDMHSVKVFSPEQSVRLQHFLEAADMVKYAGQQPDGEQIELSIARAKEFINLRMLGPIARMEGAA